MQHLNLEVPWKHIVCDRSISLQSFLNRFQIPDLSSLVTTSFTCGHLDVSFLPYFDDDSFLSYANDLRDSNVDEEDFLKACKRGGIMVIDTDIGYVADQISTVHLARIPEKRMRLAIHLAQRMNVIEGIINAHGFSRIEDEACMREFEDEKTGDLTVISDLPGYRQALPVEFSKGRAFPRKTIDLDHLSEYPIFYGSSVSAIVNPFSGDDLFCEYLIDDPLNMYYQGEGFTPIVIYPFNTRTTARQALQFLELFFSSAALYAHYLQLLQSLQEDIS